MDTQPRILLHRLQYAIVQKRWLTASGEQEAVAWFTFKYQAQQYLRDNVPKRERRYYEVLHLRNFVYTRSIGRG